MSCKRLQIVFAPLVAAIVGTAVEGAGDEFRWLSSSGIPHRKGVNILEIVFDEVPNGVGEVLLQSRIGDGEFGDCSELGLARAPKPYLMVERNSGRIAFRFALSGAFTCGEFVDGIPSDITLRLFVVPKGRDDDPVILERTVHFEPPTAPDIAFLQAIGSAEFLRRTTGGDPVENYGADSDVRASGNAEADHRSRLIIREIFRAVKISEPSPIIKGSSVTQKNPGKLADGLWQLAQANPDSSYAPYAAFYAGLVFQAEMESDLKYDLLGGEFYQQALRHPRRSLSEDALAFASRRGDAYLKPHVLRFQARLAAFVDRWDDSVRLFEEAEGACFGDGALKDSIAQQREKMREFRDGRNHR